MDYTCKKIGYLKRIRKRISKSITITIYNTIIKPLFEYGSTILYTCSTAIQVMRMQKLQNKAKITMIYDLKWLNIKQTLQFNTFMFVRKMKKSNAPKYLCEQIKYVGECQPYTYVL